MFWSYRGEKMATKKTSPQFQNGCMDKKLTVPYYAVGHKIIDPVKKVLF